jgi:hypothetical protein
LQGEREGINPTHPPLKLRGGKEGLLSLDGNPSQHFPSLDGNVSHPFPPLDRMHPLLSPSLEGRGVGEGDVFLSDRTVLVIGLGVMGQEHLVAKIGAAVSSVPI